jgi:carboxyl-terminal processing protease
MKSRSTIILTSVLIAIILLTGACSAGFVAGRVLTPSANGAAVNLPDLSGLDLPSSGTSVSEQAGTPQDLTKLFEPFWQAWGLIHDQYVDQPVDDEALMRGAIRGMLDSLGDQHTSYMDPQQLERANSQLNGEEYEGIGAWVDVRKEFLTIISPMPGSPAEKVGLKPGDQIIAVDGEDMTGVDGEIVRQQVVGPEGTEVRLTIKRPGQQETFDVVVERASITVPTVESRMLEDNIAYVHIYNFGDQTTQDLRSALKDLMAQNPDGLILDVRNDPGGFLETAIDVASEFLDGGVVMYEQYGDGTRTTYEADRGGLATDIPMVVLINQGSASASEIVAGAIQDRGRGKLVGMTSFGKGSVQVWTELVNDQGGVRVTIARWLTPDGNTIHEKGLTPDYEVDFTEEDFNAGLDPQLDKAIELLKVN